MGHAFETALKCDFRVTEARVNQQLPCSGRAYLPEVFARRNSYGRLEGRNQVLRRHFDMSRYGVHHDSFVADIVIHEPFGHQYSRRHFLFGLILTRFQQKSAKYRQADCVAQAIQIGR